MEETETNVVVKRDGMEAAGEVGDSTAYTEHEEGKMVNIVPECDSLKTYKDIVSFAEDQGVSEMSQSSVRADAVSSLHLPIPFRDCKSSAHTDQHKVQDNGLDPSEPGFTRTIDRVLRTEHLEDDQMANGLESEETNYSLAFAFPEVHALEILTDKEKENTECDILQKHQDARKAISFSELSELKQISDVAVTESASNVYLPTRLIDNNSKVHADEGKIQDNSIDPLQQGCTRILDIFTGKKHLEVNQIRDEMKSAVMHYSFPSLHQELNTPEKLANKKGFAHDTSKKFNNIVKAISFAEDHDAFKIHQSSVKADADYGSSGLSDLQKFQYTGVDPIHSTGILNSFAAENHLEDSQILNELVSSVNDDSLPRVLTQADTCESPARKNSIIISICQNSTNNVEDITVGNDTQIVQVSEGHKEFKVQNVDEAQLVTNGETVTTADVKSPGCDGCHLFSKVPNLLLDSVSPSTEVNNQDTIGPLDNPAFLRTLHYSVSYQPHMIQPVTKDELTGPKSNPDLHSHTIWQDPPDLDQGWAWVVLFAGFLANALLGATIYASGVLMLTILKDINPDLTKASWVGSVFVCAMCLSGPFVEVALRQFGARITVFCAGIVFTAGFIGASFATTISELILTHGLIAGVGAGFVTNPVSVSVGQYFFRYRGLACGLLATGAGAGMLSGGAFISLLLEQYGLSGTYLIWGGMLSHTALLGLLLRPSPEERLRVHEQNNPATEPCYGFINRSNAVSAFNSMFCSANQSMISGIDKIGHTKKTAGPQTVSTDNNGDAETHLLNTGHCSEDTPAMEVETTNQILPPSQGATQKFGQVSIGGDQQSTSLNNSPISMLRTDSPHMISSLSRDTLIKNASCLPLCDSAYFLTASDPAYARVTPYKLSSTSKSTHGLDKHINGRYRGRSILSRISWDHDAHKYKFYSSHSVTRDWSHPRSHGANWRSRFSKSLSLGIRQYTSLSASPYVTPKASSPPTIPSCSQDTLANTLHQSSSFCNAHIVATPNVTPAEDLLTSLPSSPASFRGPTAQSRIQRHRGSMASASQHTALSHSIMSYHGSIQHSCPGEMDTESITSALISQYRHRDMMVQKYPKGSRSISAFMGSVGSIPTALAIVKDDVVRYETYSTAEIPEEGLKGTGIKILDSLRLLRHRPFLIFLSVCFLWSFGESPVMIYLPSYAVSRGTSQIQASMLYTAMGAGSITGRFLSGLTASDSDIGPAIIYSGCLGIAGLLIVLSPFMTSTFLQQVVFSCLAGIYTGSLVPLSSLIVIDMLEMRELGTGFGLISMAQGMGSLIGPPLASVFVTTYGYKNLFVFSGFSLLAGSLLAMLMSAYIEDIQDMELDDQLQKSKLENELKKITNAESKQENGFHSENINKELIESSRMMKVNGATPESSRDMADGHQHYSKEEKLGTIMEISGK